VFVFISYPRKELGAFARHLAEELKERKIDYFLDEESIGTENWPRKVEENVRKANVYVILFLKETTKEASGKRRYFLEELEKIKKDSVGNDKKTIIPVTFSPESPADLPAFLGRYNAIETDIIGTQQSEDDGYWIRRIAESIGSAKKTSRIRKNLLSVFLGLIALGVTILNLSEMRINNQLQNELAMKNDQEKKFQNHIDELTNLKNGKYVCNSLRGNYRLDQRYTFVEENGYRSVANVDSTWSAKEECEYDKDNNLYILKGIDTTFFDVEVFINKKYVPIATVKQDYESRVFISSDGKLIGRKFKATTYPPDEKNITQIHNDDTVGFTESLIIEKAKEVMGYRNKKHKQLETKGCYPLLGVKGGNTAIAFVCADYIRVMERSD
jgi:hypothetical protein